MNETRTLKNTTKLVPSRKKVEAINNSGTELDTNKQKNLVLKKLSRQVFQ